MATTVGGIRVRILGDDSDLQKKLGDSTKQLAKYGAAAAAAGAAAATALTVQGLKAVDAQAKLARSLDTSIDSLRALQIAAGDAGLDGLESSMKRLNRRLGAAEMGMGEAAKSVEALGLNLQDLSAMEADERIAAIADAVRDSGVSMQQAARHAQNLGFEQAEAAAFFRQGGDAIRSYREEVQDLGLALSEVDAAKVEMANDAFSRMGLLTEGLQQQMAVEAAPFLKAISEQITESVKEMGGLGQVAENVFDFMIRGAGFVGDALHGWRVILKGAEAAYQGLGLVGVNVANEIVQAFDSAINGARELVNDMIRAMNKIPGIDMEELVVGKSAFAESMQGTADAMRDTFEDTTAELHALLMQPLPSENIKRWAEGVKEQAQVAAEAMAAAQGGSTEDSPEGGMTKEEKDKQKKLEEDLQSRLETIRESNMTELELLNEKFAMENEAINAAREQRLITEQEWDQLMRDQKGRQEDELTAIEEKAADARTRVSEAEAKAKQQALGDALSSISTLMNSESKKMFKIGKAAALAGALVDAYAAITGAYKVGASIGGPPLGAAYGAAAGLAAFQNVNAIRSASFGGGGGSPTASGGGSVTQNINAQGEGVRGQQESSRNLFVQGIDPNQMFSGRQMVEMINEAQQDGAQLRIGTA